MQQAANDIDEIKCSWLPNLALFAAHALTYSQGNSLYNSCNPGSLPLIPPQITILHKRFSMTERQCGSFKARLSSSGSCPVPYCGYTENVRLCYYFWHATSDRLRFSQRALVKALSGSFFCDVLPVPTYFSSVPRSFRTSWLYAKLDPPSWPTFTSILRTSGSKPATTYFFHFYPSFLLAPAIAVVFSTVFTRHMKMVLDSLVTAL